MISISWQEIAAFLACAVMLISLIIYITNKPSREEVEKMINQQLQITMGERLVLLESSVENINKNMTELRDIIKSFIEKN